jgi:hypothetical protein
MHDDDVGEGASDVRLSGVVQAWDLRERRAVD